MFIFILSSGSLYLLALPWFQLKSFFLFSSFFLQYLFNESSQVLFVCLKMHAFLLYFWRIFFLNSKFTVLLFQLFKYIIPLFFVHFIVYCDNLAVSHIVILLFPWKVIRDFSLCTFKCFFFFFCCQIFNDFMPICNYTVWVYGAS